MIKNSKYKTCDNTNPRYLQQLYITNWHGPSNTVGSVFMLPFFFEYGNSFAVLNCVAGLIGLSEG